MDNEETEFYRLFPYETYNLTFHEFQNFKQFLKLVFKNIEIKENG